MGNTWFVARYNAASLEPELLGLPQEMLEMLLLHLDLPSALALASTCSLLRGTLTQPRVWRGILQRAATRHLTKDTVGRAGALLAASGKSESLLLELTDNICQCFPQTLRQGLRAWSIRVLCPGHPEGHSVSPAGFLRLARAERASGCSRHPVVEVFLLNLAMAGPLLLALGAQAARQKEPVARLLVQGDGIVCRTREEGVAMAALLRKCRMWMAHHVTMEGEAGEEAWAGLAEAMGRGVVDELYVTKAVRERARGGDFTAVRGMAYGIAANWRKMKAMFGLPLSEEEEDGEEEIREI
jgi:hypothetical protein